MRFRKTVITVAEVALAPSPANCPMCGNGFASSSISITPIPATSCTGMAEKGDGRDKLYTTAERYWRLWVERSLTSL